MITEIEARVQLDKHEFDKALTLIREFVESNKHVTRIELAWDSQHIQHPLYGTFEGVEYIGLRVNVQAVGKVGVRAILQLLEKLGAEQTNEGA